MDKRVVSASGGNTISSAMAFFLIVGALTLVLRIQPAGAEGTRIIYVNADGSISPSTALLSTVDNITYMFTGNIVNGSIVVLRDNIVLDGGHYKLQGSGSGTGIDLTGRTNVTVKNAQVEAFFEGIDLNSSSNNSILGSSITNNSNGIHVYLSSSNSILGNSITNNSYAIDVYLSTSNTVSGNSITNIDIVGIWLDHSLDNTVSGNNITARAWGISITSSSNNTVSRNNITNNGYGISLDEISRAHSSDNKIYHNNFVDNYQQTSLMTSGLNVWDDGYPSGGNFWSDYNGTDINKDGVGDTPYIISADNIDHYPLMTPYPIPEFSSVIILPLFIVLALLVAVVCKKRLKQTG